MKAELFQGENDKWYWHIKARNGRIVAQSQGYSHKHGALQTLRSIEDCYRNEGIPVIDISGGEVK